MLKHWLIQSTGVRKSDEVVRSMLAGLQSVNAEFTDFGVIPFSNEITNWAEFPRIESAFVHCSTKVLRIFTNEKILPTEIFVGADPVLAGYLYDMFANGLFYDQDSFDQSLHMEHLSKVMLNGHGDVMPIRELMKHRFRNDKFVKPGKDLKLFNGEILPAGVSFKEYLETKSVDDSFQNSLNEMAIVADPVHILAEWRFFVVHGDVVAWSQYRKHGKLAPSAEVPQYVIDAAKKMAHLYVPAECFTMDLAMTENLDLKIVEYNCINCSGFYHANVGALAWALRKV